MESMTLESKFNLGEAAKVLGVTSHTVRRWTRLRRIGYFRCGRKLIFSRADLDAFLTAHRVAPSNENGGAP